MNDIQSIFKEVDMEIIARFKSGIIGASDSFYMIWKHLILLTYFGIATIIKIIVTLWTTTHSWYAYSPIVHFFIIHLPSQCVLVPLSVIAQITLAHHVAHIWERTDTTVYQSFRIILRKWQPVLLWSGVSILVTLLYKETSFTQQHPPLELSFGILGLIWTLLTLFVPILIALEAESPLEYLSSSIIIVRNYLFKIMGGLFWIALIFLICIVPFNGLWLIAKIVPRLYYSFGFMALINALELCLQGVISSACTVFKTIVYLQHKKGVDELEQLRYPRM